MKQLSVGAQEKFWEMIIENNNGECVMKELKHGKYYTCKRLKMLEYLLRNGFKPIRTIPDPDDWRYKHWLFENNSDFEKCVEQYFKNLKNN